MMLRAERLPFPCLEYHKKGKTAHEKDTFQCTPMKGTLQTVP